MTHGDAPQDPPEHGTKHLPDEIHSDSHSSVAHDHDDHGHGHGHALTFEVISEGSGQDKLLLILAFVGLVGWLMFGYFMLSAPKHEASDTTHAAGEVAPSADQHAQPNPPAGGQSAGTTPAAGEPTTSTGTSSH